MPRATPQQLCKLLRYEPCTGKLYWRERTPDMFEQTKKDNESKCRSWNAQFARKEAFTALSCGYRTSAITIKGTGRVQMKAHRVIWAIVTGEWPLDEIDHKDRNKSNNRISNLRLASCSQNNANRKSGKKRKSKYRGVSASHGSKNYRASMTHEGERIHIGCFTTAIAAARAYDAEAYKRHGEYSMLNFPQELMETASA